MRSWRVVLLLPLLAAGIAFADVAVPVLKTQVTDLTGTLTDGQRQTMAETLRQFEAKKGSQLAVLMVPTTAPETIEQYAIRVAGQWKLGRKGVDDGVLLLIAKDDRTLRIEVGYGLEGALPDAIAKRIVSDVITPFFKQGDFHAGITAGVDRIIRTIEGEPLPPPARPPNEPFAGFGHAFVLFFIGVLVVGGLLRAFLGRLLGAVLGGGLAGGVVWLVVGSSLTVAVIVFFAFFFILAVGSGRGYKGGHSGGWSGGSSGGGGFSGGGGGFGGGGASGRW